MDIDAADNVKRIVLVIPSLHPGGMERVMSELAIFFSVEKQAEVHIILLGIQEKFYVLPPAVTIHEPPFAYNKKRPFWHIVKTMRFLRGRLQHLRPDSVLSFGEMYNSFVLIAAIFTHFKIFVSDRSKPDKNWGWLHHLLRNLSYRRAAGIIAQTEKAREIMHSRLPHSNIKVIGNPIRPIQTEAVQQRKNIILTVGRLIKSKRHDLLIGLFNQADHAGWELHILGGGPEKENLETQVKALGLQDKVVFLGTHKNVAPFYAQAKIFAFTSNSEGFPNALGEAMSAGLAIITFNFIAGAGDLVINNENGWLIPENDTAQFIHQLNTLMKDEALISRFGQQGKKSIEKFYTPIIANEYYKFILSCK